MPPTLTSKPTEAFLGGSKRFKCQVIGNPRPVIRWFKDGIDITSNPRYHFDFSTEGRISMVIPNVTYKDEGCYRCRAENSEGIASTASFLMVRGSVQERRDEIPSADVAEMEIEEVYIKKKETRSFVNEISESSESTQSTKKRQQEKKDRWKESEVEVHVDYKEEQTTTSSLYEESSMQMESSMQNRSAVMETGSWQHDVEIDSSDKIVASESETDGLLVFEGQSMIIESQVFGKTPSESDTEDDADRHKPIFVDMARKRPSDELEAEDVIEIVQKSGSVYESVELSVVSTSTVEESSTSVETVKSSFMGDHYEERTDGMKVGVDTSVDGKDNETTAGVGTSSLMETSEMVTEAILEEKELSWSERREKKRKEEELARQKKKEEEELAREKKRKEEEIAREKRRKEEEKARIQRMKKFKYQQSEEIELFVEEAQDVVETEEVLSEGLEVKDAKGEVSEQELAVKQKEARRKQEEEDLAKKNQQEELTRKEQEEELVTKKQHEEELSRKKQEEELARKKQEEEELARKKQEEELTRKKQEEELSRKKQEEEALSKKKQEDEEMARKKHEEELARKKQEEEELARKKQEEEELARKKQEEEVARKKQEEELARKKKEEEEELARKKQEEELARKKQEEELARKKQEEEELARKKQEEEEELARKKQKEEELARKKQEEEELARKKQEEELVRKKQEEEELARKKREEEELARKEQEEEELARKKQEEVARKRQEEEELARKKQEEELAKKKQEEELARKKQEEEDLARKKQEEEELARKKQEEIARKKQEEEELARKKQEEDLARKKQEEEELARKKQEEQEVARKKQEEELARKKQEEELARKKQEEEELARKKQEEENLVRKKQEEELARKKQEEELARKKQEEEELTRKKQEEEELARKMLEEEELAQRKKEEELARKKKEEQELAKQKKKEEEELAREKKRKEEEQARIEKMKKFRSQQSDSEEVFVEESEEVVQTDIQEDVQSVKYKQSEQESYMSERSRQIEEGRQVEIEEFYSRETTMDGETESFREKHEVFEIETDSSREEIYDIITEDDSCVLIGATVDIGSSKVMTLESELQLRADITIEESAAREEEERMNEKNRKKMKRQMEELIVEEAAQWKISADISTEETRDIDSTEKKEDAMMQVSSEINTTEFEFKSDAKQELIFEVETEETKYKEDIFNEELLITESVHVDGVAFGEKVETMQDSENLDKGKISDTREGLAMSKMKESEESKVTEAAEGLEAVSHLGQMIPESQKLQTGDVEGIAEGVTLTSKQALTAEASVGEDITSLEVVVDVKETQTDKADGRSTSKAMASATVFEGVETQTVVETGTTMMESVLEDEVKIKGISTDSIEMATETQKVTTGQVEYRAGTAEDGAEEASVFNTEKKMAAESTESKSDLAKASKDQAESKILEDVLGTRLGQKVSELAKLDVKGEKASVEGIAEGEKMTAESRDQIESKVAQVGQDNLEKTKELLEAQEQATESKTDLLVSVDMDQVESRTSAQSGEVKGQEVKDIGALKAEDKALEATGTISIEESAAVAQMESRVEVESSVDSMQYTKELDKKLSMSVDVSVVEESSVTDEGQKLTLTSETSVTSSEIAAFSVETERTQLGIQAEISTDEPLSLKAEVTVTEESQKPVIEAVADAKKPAEASKLDVSAEVEVERVQEPMKTAPEILNGPADISVEVGQTINIEVTITGHPAPEVSWNKDFRKMEESKSVKMSMNADVYCLQILNVVLADAGKYRLTAKNSEGRAMYEVKVSVQPAKEVAQKKDEAKLTKFEKPEKSAPIIEGPADISVDEGKTLNVQMTIKGNPVPRVSWYKDSKPVIPSYRIKTKADGEVYTIQVLNTVVADAGIYRATAINMKGEVSCDVKVTIDLPPPPPKEASPAKDISISMDVKQMEPPGFSQKPTSQTVAEGEPVKLTAAVTGKPLPTVTWFKNNSLLQAGYSCKLYEQDGCHVVEFPCASIFDNGEYTLCVENPAGAVFWSGRLNIEAASEQESSSSTVGDEAVSLTEEETALIKTAITEEETPDELFLKAHVMLADHQDVSTDFSLKKGETVEVLDTLKQSKWLVRKQDDKEKVCYVPTELLKVQQVEKIKSEVTETESGKRKSSTSKRSSASKRMSEDGGSSEEEDSVKIPESLPMYTVVANYTPPDGDTSSLKLSEGQFVEVMDMDNAEKWLVRTKPTKSTPAKQGWVPASYLEEKSAKGHILRRSTREVFREDIIKISNKQQEALVKRRYVLTDFLETEREYINQLTSVIESFEEKMCKQPDVPEVFKDKKDVIFANLKEIKEFHVNEFLPGLMACAISPGLVAKTFLKMRSQFEKYIPYGCGRDNAECLMSTDEAKEYLKEYNKNSGSEQILPECLRRPIHRLHEYIAVLQDFLKYTSRAGEDCKDLEDAIFMLTWILRRVDDLKLLATVEGFVSDLGSLGPLIRHDDLQLWDAEPSGKGKDRHVFLFPDKVLLAKRKRGDAKSDAAGFIFKSINELQDIQINEAVPEDERRYELWYAEPTSEKLTFQAKNIFTREAWARDIREALKRLGVEETDIMPERRRPPKGPTVPTPPRKKTKEKESPEPEDVKPEDTGEDYISFDSYDSDVSSYHTAPEFEDGTTRPVFKKRLRKTVVKEGASVCMECAVGGKPLPSVAWMKGNLLIRSSTEDQIKIEVQGARNALLIQEAMREDSGVYTAKATNINGSAVCSAELTVGDGLDSTDQEYITAQSTVSVSSEGEITLPAEMGKMDSCLVAEGRMARFDCNLVADPKPEILWLKDGKILMTSKKYEILNPSDDLHSLIVHDVQKEDSGRYVCWARNEFGEAFTEAYLNIIPADEAEKDVERIAPKFTKKFYDLVAVDGHSAEMKFKFIGSPTPHIQWYLKNKEVLPPRDAEVKVEGDQCTFTLKEVSMQDAGKIVCKLTNPVGEEHCSAQLTVIEDLSKPRGLPKVAPKFVTRFTDVDVNLDFEARFKAKVTGEPIPTVTWLRNGVPLKECDRYKYEEYGEIFIFIVEMASMVDVGEYTCVAKNKAGEASCSANLFVTQTVIPQVRKGVNGEMGPQFGYAPVFTKLIEDCDTKEGRRAEFEGRAYGMPEPSVTWSYNGVPIARSPRHIMSKDEDSNYHLMIKDVVPSDAGQYSCKLSNFAGKASCSAELRVEALPKREPLRFSPERGVGEQADFLKKASEPPTMPDQKPTLLDKLPDSVRVSWMPARLPIKAPAGPLPTYVIESRELPTGDWKRVASRIPDNVYQVRGLNPNSEYLFRVRAENDKGISEPTQPAVLDRRPVKSKPAEKDYRMEVPQKARKDEMGLSMQTVTSGPGFPSDKPSLLDIRPESVRIQWVPVSLSGPGATYKPVKYLLEVKEIPGPWKKLASGVTANSYFATDLNPDKEYQFRVRADNKFSESEPTLPATLMKGRVAPFEHDRVDRHLLEIPKVPPVLPAYKPYVSDIGAESLRLSWKPADIPQSLKNVSPTSYRIEVQELPRPDWTPLVSYIPDTSYRLTDLRPDQDYSFRIRAENEFGLSEPSKPFYLPRTTTYPGAAATRPDIVELKSDTVRLNWQRVEIPRFEADDEPLTYMIEGKTPESDWRELVRGVRGTSHLLSDLDSDDDYSFRVRADLGTRGLGEPSPPMSLYRALARTRVPVSDIEIEDLEPTSVRLRWNRVHIPPFDASDEPLLYMLECQEGPHGDWRTMASGIPTTSFRVTDLKPQTDYAFRVRAESEYGISEPSVPKPLYRKPPESPRYHLEPPKIDSMDADALQLSWKPISPHPKIRRAEPPKYTIEMREATQVDWRPVAAGIPDTSFRLSGLQPEQDYTFRVRAEMARLTDPVHLMTPAVSLLRGPVAPVMPSTTPTISNIKPDSLRLSWRPASLPSFITGETGPIRYRIEAQEPPSSEWRTLAARISEPFYQVTGLRPDRECLFRVRAETELGTSAPTAPAYLHRKPIPTLPRMEPYISDIRPDSVRLTWQAVEVPGRAIDLQKFTYMVEMQEPPSQTWTPFMRDIHEISHKLQNLRPDKDYVFRIRAVTQEGMSEPTLSVYLPRRAVPPRLPPTQPYLSDIKTDSAKLSWSPMENPPYGAHFTPTTYRVEVLEPPNANWQTLVKKLPTTNYTLSGLRPDKLYSLRVRAENDYGVSDPTRTATLPKRAVAPVVPRDIPLVADARRGSLRLSWQPANVPSYAGATATMPVTYTIEAKEPGRDWVPFVKRIPQTSYFVTGLKPDADYEFRIRVESQYGLSPPGPSTALPRQSVSRIPIETPEITDIDADGRSVALKWRRPYVPDLEKLGEHVMYVIEAQEPPCMDWTPVVRGIIDTSYRVTGLRPRQDYLFRVRAQTSQGLGDPSMPVTFYRRLISPRVPVERPQLYDLEPDAVRLSWQPTTTYKAETPLRYTVEVREPQIKKWRPLVKSLADTSYHVTGLKPKLDYEFRVRPESDKGLLEPTPSIPLYRKRVLPPLKFEEPEVLDDEPDSVRLRWNRVSVPKFEAGDEDLTYMIEAQRLPMLDWEPVARNIRDTSYQISGLGPHEDYQFRIRGESRDFGYTEPSPTVPLYRRPILPDVPISRPVIEDVDSTSVRLGWQRVHVPSFGGDDVPLTFMIESQDSPDADWQPIARDIHDTKYQIRDLKPRHDYSFRIRGVKGPDISDPTPPLPVFRSPLSANWRPIKEDFTLAPSRPYFECLSIKVPPSMPIEKPILCDITGDSVGITWRPARVPPKSSPPSYNLEVRKLPNMNWQRLMGGLDTTTYKIPNLNPERNYMFRVKAENEYGTSGATMPVSLGRPGVDGRKTYSDEEEDGDQGYAQKATPRLPMDKPVVFEESPDVFHLSWSAARIPAYGRPSPIHYIIEKREPPSHDWTRVGSNIADTRHTVKGLKPDKDIMFRIRAESDYGISDPTLAAAVNRRAPVSVPHRSSDMSEETLMLAPSTFISGSVGTATAPRAPTGRPVISDAKDDKLELTWLPARVPTYMKATPVTYSVEVREPPSMEWSPLVSGLSETVFAVKSLKPKKDYMFRVRAENEHGSSEPTLPAILERAPEPKPEVIETKRMTPRPSPRSTPQRSLRGRTPSMERDTTPLRYTSREPTPLRRGSTVGVSAPAELIAPFDSDIQYGVEGGQAKLCLGLRGFPIPTVQWYHKGKRIENDGRYNSFIASNGEATLTINDLSLEDIGEYKCNAENENGVAVKIVQLEVADPPTFIEPLKDITVIAKSSGVLECRVDGIPYPEIKWNKDWRPLVESSRVFMDHESPDYWSLTLSSALMSDGGLYAFVAENVAGKVHCTANIIVEDQAPTKSSLKYKEANIEDHYHILEERGRGRSSIVRRVIEKSTGKEFAAKFIRVRDPVEKELFRNELECLRLANHKNISGIQDAYETDRRLVLVNELYPNSDWWRSTSSISDWWEPNSATYRITGPELLDKVVSEGHWTESDAAYFVHQLLDVLQHLHSSGVVLVDLKPWDILLSVPGSDEIKLVDLGFARQLSASRDVRTNYGTAEFAAPEVVTGEPLSAAADVWSVGVVAYILLSGISPFFAESDGGTLLVVQSASWDFDAPSFENVSREAKDFIGKVLLKEAGERLTIAECLDHPWIKLSVKRGQGLKINVDKLKALNNRYKALRASTAVKTVADVRPLAKASGSPEEGGLKPEVDLTTGETVYPDSQAYGEYLDEESWLDWQTRYQQGPGTQLLPLKDTALPLRIRQYRKHQSTEGRDTRSPSVDSEMGDERKMMKERLLVADIESEAEPSPSRRKEFEWITQPEEFKEAKRRSSSDTETSYTPKKSGVRNDEGFSPVFEEKLKDAAYLVGEDVTFRCHVVSSPAPSISWFRNEGLLSDGQRIRTSLTENGRASLTILNAMPNDIGVYKCVVRNKLGSSTSRARLLLGDNPERPGRPVVCAVSSDEALLIWEAPRSDGNAHITTYKVDQRKAGDERWATSAFVLDECVLVRNLKPSSNYRFRVSCQNQFGSSPFSWSSVEVKTKPPGAPKVEIDEEIERVLLRTRQALEKPSPRESANRKPSEELSAPDEDMRSTSPEEDYNIGEDIRKGGFSSIKCVSRKVGGEDCVAKVAPADSKKKDELIREFSLLRPLRQERIVQLIGGYQNPQQVFLVFERLYGDNVIQHLSFRNSYTEETVATIIGQVLDAVQYLHHYGIIHLNLQPSSIMMASRRRSDVKLVDFSLARSLSCPEGVHMPKMGYPEFLSPEMVAQENVGFAADLWTVGVLTFLLLGGETPFAGETDLETFANIAYNRYDAQDLYENITKEGLKFIFDILKRLPRNRLGIEECLDHKWLQLTPNMVKARQEAMFLSNKLRRYAKDYQLKRLESSGVFILTTTPPPTKPTPAPVKHEGKVDKDIMNKEPSKTKPKEKSPSPEKEMPKSKAKSPSSVKEKAKARSPSPVKEKRKPKAKSPSPVKEPVPKAKSPSPVKEPEPKAKLPSPVKEPEPKAKSTSPVKEPELKAKSPSPVIEPKVKSPSPVKEEPTPKAKSPSPVKEETMQKEVPQEPEVEAEPEKEVQVEPLPDTKADEAQKSQPHDVVPQLEEDSTVVEDVTEKMEDEIKTESTDPEPTVEVVSPVEPELVVEETVQATVDTTVVITELEPEEETGTVEFASSIALIEEPISPMPGTTPERDTLVEGVEAIVELEEESTEKSDEVSTVQIAEQASAVQVSEESEVSTSQVSGESSSTIHVSEVTEVSTVQMSEESTVSSVQMSEESTISSFQMSEEVSFSQSSQEVSIVQTSEEISTFEISEEISATLQEEDASTDEVVSFTLNSQDEKPELQEVESTDVVFALSAGEAAAEQQATLSDQNVRASIEDVAEEFTVATGGNVEHSIAGVTVSSTGNDADVSEHLVLGGETFVQMSETASYSEESASFTLSSVADDLENTLEETHTLTLASDATRAAEDVSATVSLSNSEDISETKAESTEESSMESAFTIQTAEETSATEVSVLQEGSDIADASAEVTAVSQIVEFSSGDINQGIALAMSSVISAVSEEVSDIFGDEDDDYFTKKMSKRSAGVVQMSTEQVEEYVQGDEESSRRSSRSSRRSARSYASSETEERSGEYTEEYTSSRRSRRSARAVEISDEGSSSRESRRSGWRSRLSEN